jgi:nitroimidazol reductase NimA-like FMN-containing flavoprotein (pyridoxamine 5'-phosphate oxidase superfamily)
MTTSETPLSSTARTTPTRKPQRYETDRAALHAVLDATLVCHVGLVKDGRPLVVPTAHARAGDTVFLHGSTGSGNVRAAAAGVDLCLTATVLDGIVYARSLNDHSMNYRSAVVYGRATPITDDDRKVHALRVLSERLSPGSWDYARTPNRRELAATQVLALDLTEASVKIRTGEPSLGELDHDETSVWAGVLPVHTVFGAPVTASFVPADVAPPAHVQARVGVDVTTSPAAPCDSRPDRRAR